MQRTFPVDTLLPGSRVQALKQILSLAGVGREQISGEVGERFNFCQRVWRGAVLLLSWVLR
jgi:hypothetical protein